MEFFDKSDTIRKVITKDENEMEKFVVEFLSNGKIDDVNFTEELSYLSFDINRENQLYVLKIPLDLLLSPYYVYLTETGVDISGESDQIRKTEYKQTDTHANLSFRAFANNAPSEGTIHVFGATEMEHEKLLTKLEDKMLAEKATEIDKSNSLTEAIKKQGELHEQTMYDETEDDSDEFYNNWGESQNDNNDNTIIFIIIGIVAVIIVGIIIKVKKN